MTEQQGEIYLSRQEAAAKIGISPRTLDKHADEGRIKRYRRGLRNVVFKQSDVEALDQRLKGIVPEE